MKSAGSPGYAALVVGGLCPPRDLMLSLLSGAGLVIAADSGYDRLIGLGIPPDLVVGDMDSVEDPEMKERVRRLRSVPSGAEGDDGLVPKLALWPADKDYSDTELGLMRAREEGYDQIVVLGGGGGRLDHLLAIVSLFARKDGPSRWYTGADEVILVTGRLLTTMTQGTILSLFPIGVTRAKSRGLRWKIDDLSWGPGDFGLSNEAMGGTVELRVGQGSLLLVRSQSGNGGFVPFGDVG